MKTTIKRRAKSVLAVLLTLCLVMSVFTIGISSVSAAVDDSEGLGGSKSFGNPSYWYFDDTNMNFRSHSGYSVFLVIYHSSYSKGYKMTQVSNTKIFEVKTTDTWGDADGIGVICTDNNSSDWTDGSHGYTGLGNRDYYTAAYTGNFDFNTANQSYLLTTSSSANNSTLTPTYVGKWGSSTDNTLYSPLNKTHTVNIQKTTDNGSTGTAMTIGASVKADSYKFSDVNSTESTTQTIATTANTGTIESGRTTTVSLSVPTTPTGYSFVGWYNSNTLISTSKSASYTTAGSAVTLNARFREKLPKPTFSSSTVSANAGTAATLTVSNHSTIKGKDSGVTYVLKKGSTTLTSGTDYTFDNSTGVFTLTNTTTAAAGTYTVQAVSSIAQYANSDTSSSATVTVYEPLYSLSGNDVGTGAFLINGVTPATTDPTGTNTWFNTYQSNYAINTATSTPGVYKLTFKVKDDYDGNPDISIAQTGNTQRAFILNGTEYNTSTHGDITITDAGITDANNLYLYNIGTPAGGSLYLKKGQTYTITIDQTKRYNNSSSNPWGKITVETADIFAETAAKKQAFNPTNPGYDAVSDAATTIGTASSSPVHGPKSSLTTTLTATVANNDYDFIGWYTSADCSGDPAIAASACTNSGSTYTKSVTISATTTYYALFKQKQPAQYTATLVQTSFGTLSITGGAEGSGNSYTAYRGATVSLNATTTDNSKTFSRWVITNATSGADLTSTVCASPSQATTTFTMPAQAVNITAVYASKTEVNITVTSNNESLGTAEYTAGTYYVGESSIPITATPTSGLNGGKFVRWVVTGGTVTNANAASTTITNPGVTVTARAVFENKTFQLYSKKDISGNTPSTDAEKLYPMVRMSDGRYVSTRVVNKSTDTFTIYDTSTSQYARPSTIENYELHSGYTSNDIDSWYSSDKKYTIKSTDNASYYVIFDPSGGTFGTISISTTNPLGDIAQIYAKDGSIRYATEGNTSGNLWEYDRGGTTANRGVTVVTQINSTAVPNPDTKRYPSTDQSDHFKQYSAAIGNTITIQTTVNSTYQTQGFYVGMFVINGWKVEATDVGNGKYTATFTLADEYSVNNLDGAKSFEITPVYYNKNFEYVTFYVDAASVPSKWGKTISACADYNGADNAHFEGTYPGQPLGREGDLYEIKVSKYYYDYNSSTGKWSKHTNHQPSVTITAYNYDNVHHYYYVEKDDTLNTGNKNYQTYDFSDFNYLAKIPDIEAILFRCKYETSKSSWQIYNKADSEANYNATTPAWFNVDGSQSSFNTMQVLTDYYGNPIDALGNRIEKSEGVYYTADDVSTLLSQYSTNATSKVRIVSYGNRNTNTDTANSRTAAKWATGWAVYGGGSTSGTNYFIAYGNPADFICTTPGTASTSNVKYRSGKSASDLTGKITYITYDKERTNQISGVGDTGERIDGQWYYSAQHAFDSNVKVAITTSETSAVTSSNTTIEVDSNSANNTGYIGTTSGTKATLDGNTTHTYNNVTTEAELKATVGSGYTFVGWYIYDSTANTYTKIHDNFADVNTTMTMKKNYTIIAVVRQVGEGDLVITHSRYTGNSPEAHDGTGKYYVSAIVTHSNNTTTEYAEAQNSITIPGLQASDKITISIRTVCNGVDTFYGWYEEALNNDYTRTGNYYEICNETDDPLGESEVSYTFNQADCSTFFNGATLERNTIDLYSDIVHVSAYATLTYKYYDRFETSGKNQMVSYVVKNVPLDNEEIAAGFIPSDETIAKYAPKVVDTIYTDTKWTIIGTKVERAASNVTLMATQAEKTCFVEYLLNDGVSSNLFSGNTLLDVDEVAAWNTRIVPFNSWLIDENADMDNPEESDFYVSAPSSIEKGETTYNFVRFDVYSFDRLTGEIGDVIYSSNDNHFGYRIYADCVIYPVYTTESLTPVLTANIEPAVLNREVYGDSASPVDRLYADLLISFINIANSVEGVTLSDVIKENDSAETGYSIETGVILDKSVNLSDTDFNTLKNAAINGSTDTTSTIIAKSDYDSLISETAVQNLAKDNTATTGLTKYMNQDDSGNPDNSKLTNKNRLDKVFRYTNTEAAQKRVFAAYSYIVIRRNSDNQVVASAISDQQRFNFAYIGNKPLETVS